MNPAQAHLLINHAPFFFPLIGAALYAVGAFGKKMQLEKAGLILLVLGGLAILPTYFSGDAAEHEVRDEPCRHDLIEAHEDAGKWALYLGLATALSALGILMASHNKVALASKMPARAAMLVIAVLTLATLVRTMHLGGLISHDELNADWQSREVKNRFCAPQVSTP